MEGTELKHPERPPIYLICEGEVVENPRPSHIVTELEYAVFAPVRVAYELIDKYNDEEWQSPSGMQAIANTLFMALEKWKYLSGYLSEKDFNEFPESLGVPGREYTPDEMEQIKNFYLYINREEKSKHADTIRSILELTASEGGNHV